MILCLKIIYVNRKEGDTMHKLQTHNTVERNASVNLDDVFLLDTMQAKTRYNIGRSSLTSIADSAGAVVRVGRRRLFSRQVLDEYFSAITK